MSGGRYPHAHNQKAAAESLAVAMDFAEALRVDPGFRLGFNSAGSSASVNHLHFQVRASTCACSCVFPLLAETASMTAGWNFT